MTTVNPVSASTDTAGKTERIELGKDDFLRMLITQLKHQDPFNPIDGTEFTAQLAQFTSLEQLTNMNVQLGKIDAMQSGMEKIGSVNLIGKSVLIEDNNFDAEGGEVEIRYELKDYIESGLIEIYQSDGTVVDSIEIGARGPGEYSHTWDSGGYTAGTYGFRLTAENEKGGYAVWTPKMLGLVTGVTFKDDGVYISVNGQEMALDKVAVVKEADG